MAKSKQAGLWVWAFDVHSPQIHRPTFNAMLDFLGKNEVRGFGFGGDQNDNEEISHHNKKRLILRSPGSYRRNTKFFDEQVLKPIETRLAPEATTVWIEGNHDDWENQLVEENPELQGTVERTQILNIAGRGWQIVPRGEIYELGKLVVIHGETLTGLGNQGPNYHSKKAVEAYGRSVLYGHIHSPQSFTKIAPYAKSDKFMAWCSPILGATNPSYLRNRPTAWLNGFTVVEVQESGSFNVYPIMVFDGKFRFGGKEYGSAK